MPTVIPAQEKSDFIALVAVVSTVEAAWINTYTVNYEDIPDAIDRQDAFLSYPNYLKTCLAVFTAGALTAAKIYNGLNANAGYTDPLMLIDTVQSHGVTVTSTDLANKVRVLGTSVVSEIKFNGADTIIDILTIGPAAKVSLLNTTDEATAQVNTVNIRCLRESGGELSSIKQQSIVGYINTDSCAVFGGWGVTISTGTPCALPVTNLQTTTITPNAIAISWVNQAGWFLNEAFIRLSGTTKWMPAFDINNPPSPFPSNDELIGGGIFYGDTGFGFNQLTPFTNYDIQVITTCTNGMKSAPTILLAVTTSP